MTTTEPTRRALLAGAMGAAAVPAETMGSRRAAGRGANRRGLADGRDFMFTPGLAYLQTGSAGACPQPVLQTVIDTWRDIELNPTPKCYGEYEPRMEAVRNQAAALLGAEPGDVVFTKCTTDGMNQVAAGIGLQAGDRVLTTDQEHPGGRVCWDYMARTRGISIDVVPIPAGENDPAAIVSRFAAAIGPRTRVLMFSHVLTSTGLRMPVAELTALARAHDCLSIVDGAQAVGGIRVDVKALGCDVYATSGHKWVLGPKGTGLLYIRPGMEHRVDPIMLQSGRAAYSASSGLGNIPGIMGLGRAMDYLVSLGTDRIEGHNVGLRNTLYSRLLGLSKIHLVSAEPGPLATPLLTYRLPDHVPSHDLMVAMNHRHGVVVKQVPTEWMNGQRISTHLFNDDRDLDKLVAALEKELG